MAGWCRDGRNLHPSGDYFALRELFAPPEKREAGSNPARGPRETGDPAQIGLQSVDIEVGKSCRPSRRDFSSSSRRGMPIAFFPPDPERSPREGAVIRGPARDGDARAREE